MLLQVSGWFIVIGSASLLVLICFFFLLFLQSSRRRFQYQQELQMIRSRFEKTLLETQLEIQEQTFTQISQEIHDNIGQVLSLARLNMKTLVAPGSEEKIKKTDQLLGQAITDLRHLSHHLNTDYLKRSGLPEALAQLLANLERTGKFNTAFENHADGWRVSDDASLILYRIVQEVINNIIKHADASRVTITIYEKAGGPEIVITDDGKGFDVTGVKHGIGVRNIMNRAQMIGASVEMESAINEGTTVRILAKHSGTGTVEAVALKN